MRSFAARAAALVCLVAMAVFCALELRVDTDISSFMPSGGNALLASLSKRLSDSELSRTMVLTLSAEEDARAIAAAKTLAANLAEHPEVAWVRSGVDPEQMEALYALYFPRRHAFLSADPERELPERLSDAGLRRAALRLRRELARPSAALVERIAAEDPLLAFSSVLERVRQGERTLALRDAQFVAEDGSAVIFLATHASMFESARQSALLAAIDAQVTALRAQHGADLRLESSGMNRFAVRVQAEIFRDVRIIVVASALGVAALFLFFMRSLRSFAISALPHVSGILIAATFGLLWFERLDGAAMTFGVSLVGVSIDYSIHLLTHHALAPEGGGPSATARRLRPSLVLGGLTTIASFAGLAFTNFPGFRQMGVLGAIGVGSALLVSLWVVPAFMAERPPTPALARRTAAALGGAVLRLRSARRALALLPIACLAAAAWGFPRIDWVDDLSQLTVLDPALLAEEERVRARVSRFDAGRFVLTVGSDEDAALAANDRVAASLARLREDGALDGYRSLHAYLWSASLQRANEAALRADPSLAARLSSAYAEAGFRDGAFAPFARDLALPPPEPLELAALRESPLGELLRSLVVELDEGIAVITYLSGVQDVDALARAVEQIDGAVFFDQKSFLEEIYQGYRERTLGVVASGTLLVFALLFARYRRVRESLAAFAPSILVALCLAALAAATGMKTNLLHVMGLVLVMGMGVDYGIFVVDSTRDAEHLGVTLLGLLLSCLTTIFIFGLLALSSHPALSAIGLTAGVGVTLSFLFAPVSLVVVGAGSAHRSRAGGA